MSCLEYEEKSRPWGRIRKYTNEIPSISLLVKIFAEREDSEEFECKYIEIYYQEKGRSSLHKKGKVLEFDEGNFYINDEGGKIVVKKGGILQIIRLEAGYSGVVPIPIMEPVKPKIEKPAPIPIPI